MVKALAVIVVSLGVALGVGWGVAQGGTSVLGVPVVLLCVGLAFVVQWVAFVPAYLTQSERFYDLVGSLTYLSCTWLAVLASGPLHPRQLLFAGAVTLWAVRLGTFLFRRVHKAGKDGRFDEIKKSASRFVIAWTLQGLWVSLTLAAALAAITRQEPAPLGWVDALGLAIWALGFVVEVVADRQKSAFREEKPGAFIDRGLWAWSRHPNYFGEILLWTGLAIGSLSTLRGANLVALISPVFVYVLLTRISGIPLLEERAKERWGEPYLAYQAKTPALFPRPPG